MSNPSTKGISPQLCALILPLRHREKSLARQTLRQFLGNALKHFGTKTGPNSRTSVQVGTEIHSFYYAVGLVSENYLYDSNCAVYSWT